jgi:hypothetical protein
MCMWAFCCFCCYWRRALVRGGPIGCMGFILSSCICFVSNYMDSLAEGTIRCWELLLVSLCGFVISVSMIYPVMRVGSWILPLLLCEVQFVVLALAMFLLQMWVPLHLEHIYSELRVHLGGFFLWCIWSVLPHLFFFLITFGWNSILLDIRMTTLVCFLVPLAWNFFSSLLLWVGVYLCHWVGCLFVCLFLHTAKYWVLFI